MKLTKEEDRKLLRAVLHTKCQDKIEESGQEGEKLRAFMEAWDGVRVTVANFVQGEYSVVGWPPEEEEKVKDAIYKMEQATMAGKYENNREAFEADWAAGKWEPMGAIIFPPGMVEILGELRKRGE